MLTLDQYKTLSEAGREGARQVARLAIENQEQMVADSIDALEEVLERGGQTLAEACAELKQVEPAALLPWLASRLPSWHCALAASALTVGLDWRQTLATTSQARMRGVANAWFDAWERYATSWRDSGAVLLPPLTLPAPQPMQIAA